MNKINETITQDEKTPIDRSIEIGAKVPAVSQKREHNAIS